MSRDGYPVRERSRTATESVRHFAAGEPYYPQAWAAKGDPFYELQCGRRIQRSKISLEEPDTPTVACAACASTSASER